MPSATPPEPERVRVAEISAALCLATDLGMGFPFEHGLHATLMAMRLCEILDTDDDTAAQTYYAAMLMYTGCNTDVEKNAAIFSGSRTEHITPATFGSYPERLAGVFRAIPPPGAGPIGRALEVARRLPLAARSVSGHFTAICEVAQMLSERLGLPAEVSGLFPFLTERWDGSSILRRAEGDDIPLALRVVHVAQDAAYQSHVGGREHAIDVISKRAGHGFDPEIASRFVAQAADVFESAETEGSVWGTVLEREPGRHLVLEDAPIDGALAAFGDFSDLVSSDLSGHSAGIAKLVDRAAQTAGLGPEQGTRVRRAALVHDIGRTAVDPRIWLKPDRLTIDEQEQVRLHPYHTERVLSRSPFLRDLAEVAADHHERMDGSGYHRGVAASEMTPESRLLAAADTFHAMTEPRPHRRALPIDQAAGRLGDEANKGLLDPDMAAAVIEAAGEPVPELARPAGLTQREAEVIGLVARGLQTKQVASHLGMSPKTADTHIQNAYRKIGVSTRAAATLFAMEHGLVPSGELPMEG